MSIKQETIRVTLNCTAGSLYEDILGGERDFTFEFVGSPWDLADGRQDERILDAVDVDTSLEYEELGGGICAEHFYDCVEVKSIEINEVESPWGSHAEHGGHICFVFELFGVIAQYGWDCVLAFINSELDGAANRFYLDEEDDSYFRGFAATHSCQ